MTVKPIGQRPIEKYQYQQLLTVYDDGSSSASAIRLLQATKLSSYPATRGMLNERPDSGGGIPSLGRGLRRPAWAP